MSDGHVPVIVLAANVHGDPLGCAVLNAELGLPLRVAEQHLQPVAWDTGQV